MSVAPDIPLLRFMLWLVNTPGVGGAGVAAVILAALASFVAALRWIARGSQAGETLVYAYPTPTLLEHEKGLQ